jgi:hypothetical protein
VMSESVGLLGDLLGSAVLELPVAGVCLLF